MAFGTLGTKDQEDCTNGGKAGEPALPGISIGHNERIAFGLTIFPIDQEDLYVYELHPDDPARYRYDGEWEAMRVVGERVPVRGEAPRDVQLGLFAPQAPSPAIQALRALDLDRLTPIEAMNHLAELKRLAEDR